MVNFIKVIFVLLISNISISSDVLEKYLIETPKVDDMAFVLSFSGNRKGLTLKSFDIKKPNYNSITNYKIPNKRDDYVLRILDKNKKEVAQIGLGNPFFISAQHIDYEHTESFGDYIDNKDIKVVVPNNIDASFAVLASQDPFGLYDINEISLVEPLAKK